MNRKATPDVLEQTDRLGEMMGSPIKDNKTIKIEDNKAVSMESNKTSKQERNKEIKPQSNKIDVQKVSQKRKVTFNLSLEARDHLEDIWIKLRKGKREVRITKTLIIEAAINMVFKDCDLKGENSDLFRSL